jgi:hypothetical protein
MSDRAFFALVNGFIALCAVAFVAVIGLTAYELAHLDPDRVARRAGEVAASFKEGFDGE